MPALKSRISDDIRIEHVDESFPEHFVVSADGLSYRVFPANGIAVMGEIAAVTDAGRPSAVNDGTDVRFALVHDSRAARSAGLTTAWVPYFRVLSTPQDGPEVGGYHSTSGYGTRKATATENADPDFGVVFEDVTAEFLAAATPDQLQARSEFGPVYQRLCVDFSADRAWIDELGDGIVFSGSSASALSDMPSRVRSGLLVEAGFADMAAFSSACFKQHPQTEATAAALSGLEVTRLPVDNSDALDAYRLHSDVKVQDECYRDMAAAALARAVVAPFPPAEFHPSIVQTAPTMSARF